MKTPHPVDREIMDELLFEALKSLHRFELSKVRRFELSFQHIYLLQYLRRHSPMSMSGIAMEMGLPVSSATRLIERLERMKLVYRRKSDEDRRVTLVLLHGNGEQAVRLVEEHSYEIISANLKKFSKKEVESFLTTARFIGRILHSDT